MAQPELTTEQMTSVMSVILQELKILFKLLPTSSLEEDAVIKKRILTDIKTLLKKGYGVEPSDEALLEIFDKRT